MTKRIYGAERFESRADTLALDTETYYDTDYSVSKMGHLAYVRDPRFVCTVAAVTDGHTTWVGAPSQFNWGALNDKAIVAHNAEFDRHVVEEMARRGQVPRFTPRRWFDSASACAYLQHPRNLAGAVASLGLAKDFPVDKSIRTAMCGQTYHSCLPGLEASDPWLQYAALDPEACLAVWNKIEKRWPGHERKLYDMTVAMGRRGICVDVPYVKAGLEKLYRVRDQLRRKIQWSPQGSHAAFCEAVTAELHVSPPASTNDDDPRFLEWADQQAGSTALVWAEMLQEWRTLARTIAALEGILSRMFDGRFRFELLYYGAGPGRWSGAGGWNTQNMTKAPVHGVELRRSFVAAPGHTFLIVDFAQVEARALLWEAADTEALALVRQGVSVYEAHARATMGYLGPSPLKDHNKRLYALAKARVLGLGYGCGKSKFRAVAKIMAGMDITQDEADKAVDDYRKSNPKVIAVWRRFEAEARSRIGGTYANWLPYGKTCKESFRALFYRNVREEMIDGRSQLRCEVGGRTKPIYGGLLTENYIQAMCRDALGAAWIECDEAGMPPVVLSVHDESVFEVPEADIEEVRREVTRLMCKERAWARGFPLGVEAVVSPFYLK